jgi:hypothetical protein
MNDKIPGSIRGALAPRSGVGSDGPCNFCVDADRVPHGKTHEPRPPDVEPGKRDIKLRPSLHRVVGHAYIHRIADRVRVAVKRQFAGDGPPWVIEEGNAHTTTAYHPSYADHPLRIPEAAEPWDSGTLYKPGALFGVTFTREGVYDYYCKPHEAGGMAGRIVVGAPGGPGDRPFGYWQDGPMAGECTEVPDAVQSTLPSPERIVEDGRIRRPDS